MCKEGWYRDHTQAFTHYLIPVDTYIAAFVPDIHIIHIDTVICFSNHLIGHVVPPHCSCSSMLTHEHFLHVMLINEICPCRAATLCHIGSSVTRLEEIVLIHEGALSILPHGAASQKLVYSVLLPSIRVMKRNGAVVPGSLIYLLFRLSAVASH